MGKKNESFHLTSCFSSTQQFLSILGKPALPCIPTASARSRSPPPLAPPPAQGLLIGPQASAPFLIYSPHSSQGSTFHTKIRLGYSLLWNSKGILPTTLRVKPKFLPFPTRPSRAWPFCFPTPLSVYTPHGKLVPSFCPWACPAFAFMKSPCTSQALSQESLHSWHSTVPLPQRGLPCSLRLKGHPPIQSGRSLSYHTMSVHSIYQYLIFPLLHIFLRCLSC